MGQSDQASPGSISASSTTSSLFEAAFKNRTAPIRGTVTGAGTPSPSIELGSSLVRGLYGAWSARDHSNIDPALLAEDQIAQAPSRMTPPSFGQILAQRKAAQAQAGPATTGSLGTAFPAPEPPTTLGLGAGATSSASGARAIVPEDMSDPAPEPTTPSALPADAAGPSTTAASSVSGQLYTDPGAPAPVVEDSSEPSVLGESQDADRGGPAGGDLSRAKTPLAPEEELTNVSATAGPISGPAEPTAGEGASPASQAGPVASSSGSVLPDGSALHQGTSYQQIARSSAVDSNIGLLSPVASNRPSPAPEASLDPQEDRPLGAKLSEVAAGGDDTVDGTVDGEGGVDDFNDIAALLQGDKSSSASEADEADADATATALIATHSTTSAPIPVVPAAQENTETQGAPQAAPEVVAARREDAEATTAAGAEGDDVMQLAQQVIGGVSRDTANGAAPATPPTADGSAPQDLSPGYPDVGSTFPSLDSFKDACKAAAIAHGHKVHVRSQTKSASKFSVTLACSMDRKAGCGLRIGADGPAEWMSEDVWTVTKTHLVHSGHTVDDTILASTPVTEPPATQSSSTKGRIKKLSAKAKDSLATGLGLDKKSKSPKEKSEKTAKTSASKRRSDKETLASSSQVTATNNPFDFPLEELASKEPAAEEPAPSPAPRRLFLKPKNKRAAEISVPKSPKPTPESEIRPRKFALSIPRIPKAAKRVDFAPVSEPSGGNSQPEEMEVDELSSDDPTALESPKKVSGSKSKRSSVVEPATSVAGKKRARIPDDEEIDEPASTTRSKISKVVKDVVMGGKRRRASLQPPPAVGPTKRSARVAGIEPEVIEEEPVPKKSRPSKPLPEDPTPVELVPTEGSAKKAKAAATNGVSVNGGGAGLTDFLTSLHPRFDSLASALEGAGVDEDILTSTEPGEVKAFLEDLASAGQEVPRWAITVLPMKLTARKAGVVA